MTKQQKARAHLARAQLLLQGHGSSPYNTRVTSNEAFGFGTGGEGDATELDIGDAEYTLQYEKLPLSARVIIESQLDKKQKKNLALSSIKTLRILAQDDQFLVNALQDHDHMAHLLLQYRDKTPEIPKDSIRNIDGTVNSTESYAMIMNKILQGALNEERRVELNLQRIPRGFTIGSTLITGPGRHAGCFSAKALEEGFNLTEGQELEIRLVLDRYTYEITYEVAGHNYKGMNYKGKVTLGPAHVSPLGGSKTLS